MILLYHISELSNGLLKEEDVHIASFNITDKEQMQKHFQDVITKFGHVDILVKNRNLFGHESLD